MTIQQLIDQGYYRVESDKWPALESTEYHFVWVSGARAGKSTPEIQPQLWVRKVRARRTCGERE